MLEYRVCPTHPETREFELELRLERPDPAGQVFAMAAWTPGSYMVRDHARHVTHIEALDDEGRTLSLTWVDKQTWRAPPCAGPLTLRWRVHAHELSVRTASLNTQWGFADGAALWLRPLGHEAEPCRVELVRSESPYAQAWRATIMLAPVQVDSYGYGYFFAEDFEALIDAPLAFGPLQGIDFRVHGVAHRFTWLGVARFDQARLGEDLARVCEAVAALFDGELPFSRYQFLALVTGDGYGGLEHREGTALLCKREHLPQPGEAERCAAYREFLGLCSHEYLHAWLVKRIRPAALMGLPLQQEAYTRLLWLFEGWTSYYDDLVLVRAGLIRPEEYLETLAATISRVQRTPGRRRMSLEHASLTAWTRLYKADENTPNVGISYYSKGALFAWVLDAELRRRSQDRVCLDGLLRALWHEYGRSSVGVAEEDIEGWLEQQAGVPLADLFAAGLRGVDDLPLEQAAESFGLRLEWLPEREAPWLGAEVRVNSAGQAVLGTVYTGGPAEQAGLAPQDVLLALDGLRVDASSLDALLMRLPLGEPVRVHVFRRDELVEGLITLSAPPALKCRLTIDANAKAKDRTLAWMGLESDKNLAQEHAFWG